MSSPDNQSQGSTRSAPASPDATQTSTSQGSTHSAPASTGVPPTSTRKGKNKSKNRNAKPTRGELDCRHLLCKMLNLPPDNPLFRGFLHYAGGYAAMDPMHILVITEDDLKTLTYEHHDKDSKTVTEIPVPKGHLTYVRLIQAYVQRRQRLKIPVDRDFQSITPDMFDDFKLEYQQSASTKAPMPPGLVNLLLIPFVILNAALNAMLRCLSHSRRLPNGTNGTDILSPKHALRVLKRSSTAPTRPSMLPPLISSASVNSAYTLSSSLT